jgi:hypothetical protein
VVWSLADWLETRGVLGAALHRLSASANQDSSDWSPLRIPLDLLPLADALPGLAERLSQHLGKSCHAATTELFRRDSQGPATTVPPSDDAPPNALQLTVRQASFMRCANMAPFHPLVSGCGLTFSTPRPALSSAPCPRLLLGGSILEVSCARCMGPCRRCQVSQPLCTAVCYCEYLCSAFLSAYYPSIGGHQPGQPTVHK